VIWTWDAEKDRTNKLKHRISFETALLVFDDPLALSRPDPHPDGDRWRSVGAIGSATVFKVHTQPMPNPRTGQEIGRIISVRKATSHERRAYEEGKF